MLPGHTMEPDWSPSSASRAATDSIFSPGLHPALDEVASGDLVWRTLARTVLPSALVEAVLYFVWPERVWHSRLPAYKRLFLKQDLMLLRSHLQSCQRTSGKVGLPVTLLLGSPGIFALHLPELVLGSESENQQDHVALAHRPEEIALVTHWLSKYGTALRTLHVALDLRDEMAVSVKAQGAAALLFVLLARGELRRLNHLTLLHAGHGTSTTHAFLSPLACAGAAQLDKLRTLRVSFVQPHLPLRHLAALASRGGLRGLQDLIFFGDSLAEDADLAALLQALLAPTHVLRELDIRSTKAGVETLGLIVERLGAGSCPRLRSAQTAEDLQGNDVVNLRRRLDELFHP
jgi:hypothetical protein